MPRIHEWAKEYDVKTKNLIELIKKEKGLELTAFHKLDEQIVLELEEKIKALKEQPTVEEPPKPKPKKVLLVKKEEIEKEEEKKEESPQIVIKKEKEPEQIITKKEIIEEIKPEEKKIKEQKIKFKKEKEDIEKKEHFEEERKEKDRKKSSGKGGKKTIEIEDVEEQEIETPFKNLIIRDGAFKKFTPKRFKDVSKAKGKSRLTRELKKSKIQQKLLEEQKIKEEEEKTIKITDPTTPQKIAEQLKVSVNEIIGKLFKMNILATVNQRISAEVAELLAEEYGYKIKIAKLYEDEIVPITIERTKEVKGELIERAPVVTVMGHVDHGKTSLLDAIRKTNVAAQEAGGITQHIGAYKIIHNNKEIVFLDTPGHEAFTAMRARGANCTDIVVLVVAADDGIMPQTIEAINHARAANVPIIVAINKIDKPNINLNRIKQQLGNYDLLPEEWGGKTICVEVSAIKNINIDQLLEMILLQAELLELKTNPLLPAAGTILEVKLEKGIGPVINLLVQEGTLKKGDYFVAGLYYGRVRALINDKGERLEKVVAAAPIQVIGVTDLPQAGDPFNVVENEKKAKEISQKRLEIKREYDLKKKEKITLDNIFKLTKEDTKVLNLIIKADVSGSVEAITSFLQDLNSDKVKINIIHSAVGGINDNDISLAIASNAIIIGFNVRADLNALQRAEKENVEIRYYDIIFKLKEDIIKALEGMLETIKTENVIGRGIVKKLFKISKVGTVAGCQILNGKVTRNSKVRLIRDKVVIYNGEIGSLKRHKDDVSEVSAGLECGLSIKNYDDIKENDELEFYTIIEKKQTL